MATFWIRSAVATALAAACVQAHAASVTLTGWAFGNGNNVQTTHYSGAAGGFTGALTGTGAADTHSFVTYCVELSEFFSFSAAPMVGYQLVDGASYFERRRGDAGIADRLGRLMTFVSQNRAQVDSATESTSMQLAVWNTVYDTDWNVTVAGTYRNFGSSASLNPQADSLLAGALGVASTFNVFVLEKVGSQDFLVVTPRSQVPEPTSMALVALALVGLGAARKRKLSAGTASPVV